MRKYCIAVILVLFFTVVTSHAQDLTETEVVETMNRAFELNKAEKYDEALEAFLLVGKNTEKQRAEEERQVYVCSQIMVAMCCELTGKYEEGYLLAKKLLQGKLTDEEKENAAYRSEERRVGKEC